MRKNGFTLIELLAVIVILAIIALIATPIILGIINDAREKANERSVELYASAVRNGIAAYQLREMKEVAAGTYTSETLPFDVEYDGDVVCTTIELYEDGGVYVAGCEVNDTEVEYTYGIKGVFKGKMSSVCKQISVAQEGVYTAGDKYECDVDPNKEGYDYTFYVLTTTSEGATSVNLIMDSNINISGETVKEGVTDLGEIAWILEEDYSGPNWDALDDNNAYGPITAMKYLQTVTANWTNLNPITTNTFTACDGYDSCEEQTMKTYTTYARMPYLSEVSDYSVDANNSYLYDNLHLSCFSDDEWGYEIACSEALGENKLGVDIEGLDHINGIVGYWILSSYTNTVDQDLAWYMDFQGSAGGYFVYDGYAYDGDTGSYVAGPIGVRPVINLSI